jgi:hypothetical protein
MCGVSTSLRFPGQLNGSVRMQSFRTLTDSGYIFSDLQKLCLNLIFFRCHHHLYHHEWGIPPPSLYLLLPQQNKSGWLLFVCLLPLCVIKFIISDVVCAWRAAVLWNYDRGVVSILAVHGWGAPVWGRDGKEGRYRCTEGGYMQAITLLVS